MSTNHLSSVFTGFVGTFLGYKEAAKQRFRESARPEANCRPILNEFFVSSMTDLHSRLKAYIHAQVGDFGGGDPNDAKPNISGSPISYSSSTNNIENGYEHKKYRANAQTNVEDSKNVQTRDDAVPVGSPSFFNPNSRTLDARAYAEYNSSDELKYSQTREHAVIAATLSNNNQNSRTLDSRENAESILSAELKNVQIGEENSVIASTLSNNHSHSRVRDARANAVANAQLNAPAGSEYINILFYSIIPNSRMLDARADAESNSSVGLGNIQIRDDAATISTPSTVAQNCRNYSRANARTYDRSNAVAAPKNATTKNDSVTKNIITNASSSSLPNANLANAQDVIIKDEVDEVRDNVPVDLDSLSPFSSTNAHKHRIMMMQKNALANGVSTTVTPTTTQENCQRAENGQILDSGHHHSAQYQSVLSNLKVIICNAPPNNNAASSNVSYWRNSVYAKANQQDQLTNGHENGSSFSENARARNNASHNASSTTTTKNCDSVNSVSKVVVKEEVESDDESPAASSTLKNAEALACAQMLQDNARLKARAGTVERNNFQRRMPQTRSALNAVSVSAEALAAARQEYARKKDRENAQKNAQQNVQQNAQQNARANAPNDASPSTGASSYDARVHSRVNAQENASTRTGTVRNIVPPMPLLRNALANAQQPSTSAGTSSSMCDQMLNNAGAGTNDFNPKPSTPGQDVYPNSEPSTSRAWIRARATVLARNIVSQPPKVVTQPEPHLSFTYAPHPNLDLYDDDFDVQEGQEEQGRDPNLPEFPSIEHYRRREPSPCPLDSDHEFERLWRSDDELAPENVRADPDYRPSRGKKLGPRTPRVVAKSQANKRPRVVNAESGEQDEEELDEAGSGTPAGSKKRNVASPRADGGGNDKMKVKIVELNCSEDNCEVTVPSLGAFNRHLFVAHGIRSCRCYVEGCGASYESKSDMSEHIRVAHARLRQWPCCRCSKHFLSYPTLRTHQLTHQAGVFQCETCAEECGYTASNRMKVYGHIRLARKRAAKVAAASGNVAAAGEGGSQKDSFVDSQDSVLLEDFPLDDSEDVSREDSQVVSKQQNSQGGSKKYSQQVSQGDSQDD